MRIVNVHIHVDRVIGNIRKKYSLLSATQPVHFLISPDDSKPLLDKIVYVCCAFINICDSVVPLALLQLLTSPPFKAWKFSTVWTIPMFRSR